jgi:choloylglycine hydrolase
VSDDRFIGEGMNEAGLNAGLFYFPGYGSLAPYDPARTANNVADMDLVRWMLSQFSTVGEVRAALDDIRVAPIFIDESGQPSPTAHWRVTDREGGSIVIEIIDGGQVQVYDNQVGVLTNSPGFPWHLLNLNNFVQLEPGTVGPRRFNELKASSFGAGTGFLGLPGDITPPSRFVRAAFFVATAPTMETSSQAVSQAFHILNNFDIPIGTEFGAAERSKMPDLPSATQWTAVSDLDQGAFYFKSMHDGAVKRVDLGRIDFAGGQETATALDTGAFGFREVTP